MRRKSGISTLPENLVVAAGLAAGDLDSSRTFISVSGSATATGSTGFSTGLAGLEKNKLFGLAAVLA